MNAVFVQPMQLELIPIRTLGLPPVEKRLAALQPRRFRLVRDWYFKVPGGPECVIPKGHSPGVPWEYQFTTDGSSYPQLTRVVYDPIGISIGAGLPHDWIYQYRRLITAHGDFWTPDPDAQPFTRFQADDLFKRMNLQINDIPELAYSTYTTLRIVGGIAWKRHREKDGTPYNDIHFYWEDR